ncbi:MAG: AMP-binding protein [Actinomycetota bacterium]|nr:AMP-binding protein [Actinomycetota bacterium]
MGRRDARRANRQALRRSEVIAGIGTSEFGIAAHAQSRPDQTAIVAGDRRVTYAELDARANQVAHAMRNAGIVPGDRVALAMRNRPEFFEAAAGAARAGAEVVSIGWRFKSDEVRYLVEDSKAKLIVAESTARFTTKALGIIDWHLGGDYEDSLEEAPRTPIEDAPLPAPPRFRFYTSGTTGQPKAVERPVTPTGDYIERTKSFPPLDGLTKPGLVHLACGPMYHTAPCAFANYALLFGHTVVLMDHFEAEEALSLIESERVTWTHMVPINFIRILNIDEDVRKKYDLKSLKKVLHAAAPCPVDVKKQIMKVFPRNVVWEYYGMTEAFATIISPSEWQKKPGSVGKAAPGVTMKILDEKGKELPPGETGVVYLIPSGGKFAYAGAPEKTKESWRGDLFTVGDMGYLDEDGYLFLTDRRQDMIITGGANVYPAEVEATLYKHPAVADVAVIGVPDDEWGEAVKAIVETRKPVKAEELIDFCRENLAHFKCPKTVELVDKLPRDENGKVRKRDLRDPYWAGRPARI